MRVWLTNTSFLYLLYCFEIVGICLSIGANVEKLKSESTNIHERKGSPLLAKVSCQDQNTSFCTAHNFNLNPYDSYIQCRRSMNNCNGCMCDDSRYPYGIHCKTLLQSLCVAPIVWHKCPLRCNKCVGVLASGCPPCLDSFKGCTTQLCDRTPGLFYPLCKHTCNNCDGCYCVDSSFENCTAYKAHNLCGTQKAHWYCPVTCSLCDKVKKAANATVCTSDCYDENYSIAANLQCSQDNCNNRPGFFLRRCHHTCKNCDGCKCFDSISPSISCSKFKKAGNCTNPLQLQTALEYCPLTCGKCGNFTSFACPKHQKNV